MSNPIPVGSAGSSMKAPGTDRTSARGLNLLPAERRWRAGDRCANAVQQFEADAQISAVGVDPAGALWQWVGARAKAAYRQGHREVVDVHPLAQRRGLADPNGRGLLGVGTTFWIRFLVRRYADQQGHFSGRAALDAVIWTALTLSALHVAEIVVWAFAWLLLAGDKIRTLEAAVCFSVVTFTTVG
jgi:hypothetical protein